MQLIDRTPAAWQEHGIPTLIGEAPGRTPGLPFDGRIGRFMERLTGKHPRKAFACRNVLRSYPGAVFPLAAARVEASKMVLSGVVLLAGTRVAAAFMVRPVYFVEQRVGDARVFVIPHPSGRNRWWNSAANWTLACEFLRRFV